MTLYETGAGSAVFEGNSVTANDGVAEFAGLTITYTASDPTGEAFALQADDTAGGPEGDIGDLPTSSATSVTGLDFDGQLFAGSAVAEPVALPTSATDESSGVDIFDFTLSDGGAGDGEALLVDAVTLHTSGDGPFGQVACRLSGPDGSADGVYDGGDNTISFSGLNISVADGESETYRVNAYLADLSLFANGSTLGLSLNGDVDLSVDANGTQMSGANTTLSNGSGTPLQYSQATLSFANRGTMAFDDNPKSAIVTTDPANLPVQITYDGNGSAPSGPGQYEVVATVVNSVYTGTATSLITIQPPPAPTPVLTASITEGPAPLVVEFTNRSTGYIVYSFIEAFDSEHVTIDPTSVEIEFEEPGTHEVVLTAKGIGGSRSASVMITVHGPPTLADLPSVQALEDESVVLDLSSLDSNPGSWSVDVSSSSLIATAELSADELRLTPKRDRAGSENVEVVRRNAHGLETATQIQVTWTAVDDPPQIMPAFEAAFTAWEDESIRLDLARHLHDVDTDPAHLTWVAVGFDEQLVADVQVASGELVFVPAAEISGETQATICVSDPATGTSSSQSIQLRWNAVDDTPEPALAIRPADGASDFAVIPTLVWSSQLVDGQAVEYDVYFGSESDPLEMKAAALTGNEWEPGLLEPNTLYFWKVVTRSRAGVETASAFVFSTTELPSTANGDPIQGLFDEDEIVDFNDFFLFADRFGERSGSPGFDPVYDLDSDGVVDFRDFFIFADNFGRVAVTR